MRLRLILAALATSLTAGCMQEGMVADPHTGLHAYRSPNHVAMMGLGRSIGANTIAGTRAGKPLWGVETRYTAPGEFARFSEAWSHGTRLPYEGTSMATAGCDILGCTRYETGVILMTEAQFRTAARDGFAFKLSGPGGSAEGSIPAAMFQKALAATAGSQGG